MMNKSDKIGTAVIIVALIVLLLAVSGYIPGTGQGTIVLGGVIAVVIGIGILVVPRSGSDADDWTAPFSKPQDRK